MTWIDIIQSVGIIASLSFTLFQMRIFIKSLKASSHMAILNRLDGVNRVLFEHPEEFARLREAYSPKSLPETDRRAHLMDMIFSLFEEVYLQHRKYRFMDREFLSPWIRTIKRTFNFPYAVGYWQIVKEEYPESFRIFIHGLLSSPE